MVLFNKPEKVVLATRYEFLTNSVYLNILLFTVVVGFEHETYSISEGNGSVEVCIQVSGILQSSLSISLTTVDGTSTGEQGYAIATQELCVNS